MWWCSWVAWFVVLFVLSSFSGYPGPTPPMEFSDKFLHAAYFACGSAIFYIALGFGRKPVRSNSLLLIACVGMAAAVGAFDEWHQSFTPGRSGNDLGDWIADIVGGVIGWTAGVLLRRRFPATGPLAEAS